MEFDVWSHDLMELGDTQRARDELSEFRYLDGERIHVGDSVMLNGEPVRGMFRVTALDTLGYRVTVHGKSGTIDARPSELLCLHSNS